MANLTTMGFLEFPIIQMPMCCYEGLELFYSTHKRTSLQPAAPHSLTSQSLVTSSTPDLEAIW